METVEKVRLWSILEDDAVRSGDKAPIEVEAMFDTGGTRVILPPGVAVDLRLVRRDEDEAVHGLMIEIHGRVSICRAFVEPNAAHIRISRLVMEDLNLGIDVPGGRVVALDGPQGRSGYYRPLG